MAKLTDEERNWRQGFGLALAEVNRMFDQPTIVCSVMEAANMTVAKLKCAGLDDYDVAELRKAMR